MERERARLLVRDQYEVAVVLSFTGSLALQLLGGPSISTGPSGWADHPLRRSPKPSRTVRPCWTTWLGSFSFWRTLALADG